MSAAEERLSLQKVLDKAVVAYRENPTAENKRYHDYVARRYMEAAIRAEIEELTGELFDA